MQDSRHFNFIREAIIILTGQTKANINLWRGFEIGSIDADHFPVKFTAIAATFHLAALMLGVFVERNNFGVFLHTCCEFIAFLAFIRLGSAGCRDASSGRTDVHVTVEAMLHARLAAIDFRAE